MAAAPGPLRLGRCARGALAARSRFPCCVTSCQDTRHTRFPGARCVQPRYTRSRDQVRSCKSMCCVNRFHVRASCVFFDRPTVFHRVAPDCCSGRCIGLLRRCARGPRGVHNLCKTLSELVVFASAAEYTSKLPRVGFCCDFIVTSFVSQVVGFCLVG